MLKANQVLLEMLPDVTHCDELEIQVAQLVPALIENLGNSKVRYLLCNGVQALVRKSTHKCMATYVKLTKKLEYVLLHLIHTGLEN